MARYKVIKPASHLTIGQIVTDEQIRSHPLIRGHGSAKRLIELGTIRPAADNEVDEVSATESNVDQIATHEAALASDRGQIAPGTIVKGSESDHGDLSPDTPTNLPAGVNGGVAAGVPRGRGRPRKVESTPGTPSTPSTPSTPTPSRPPTQPAAHTPPPMPPPSHPPVTNTPVPGGAIDKALSGGQTPPPTPPPAK